MMRAAICAAMLACLLGCGTVQRLRDAVADDAALACARASDGTDSSIADCYTSRGLPLPERI